MLEQQEYKQFQVLIFHSVLLSLHLADNQEAYKVHIINWISLE